MEIGKALEVSWGLSGFLACLYAIQRVSSFPSPSRWVLDTIGLDYFIVLREFKRSRRAALSCLFYSLLSQVNAKVIMFVKAVSKNRLTLMEGKIGQISGTVSFM